jgi:outer membrane protein assembly factor BamB
MKKFYILVLIVFATCNCSVAASASDIIKASGVKGGLVVHLGCGDGKLTADLRQNESYMVFGLETEAGKIAKARENIKELGIYGKVTVDTFNGENLPFIDNVVNLLIAESLGDVSQDEVVRVLTPGGVAMIGSGGKWRRLTKPIPSEIDEWTHYLHDASNNAVSNDKKVSYPYHMQWFGLPKWTRNHNYLNSYSAVVSSGGRVFYILDDAPAHSVQYPSKWTLVARDAYNGVVLWKKTIDQWEGHLRRFRSGPTELPRRLVAVGERVYVTLGYGEPVTALDAATGKVVRQYKETDGTNEIIYSNGTLYLVGGHIDKKEYEKSSEIETFSPPIQDKRIIAIDADSGRLIWAKDDADTDQMLPTTLCLDEKKVFFHSPDELICLDRKTGKELWKSPRPVEHDRLAWSSPTLVVYGDVLLSAEGKHGGKKDEAKRRTDSAGEAGPSAIKWTVSATPRSDYGGELIAFSASDGKELWRCDAAFGYSSPPDLFVADGLVWVSAEPGMNETDMTLGRDLLTGKVIRSIETTEAYDTAHHHRCYRDKATNDFLLLGRTGVEFVDLQSKEIQRHYWIRGTCQYGLMPANGLIYLPGHSCGCYIQSKLNGFLAMAPARDEAPVNENNRLEKGPAYKRIENKKTKFENKNDWPMLRYDTARSSYTKTVVPKDLKPKWKTNLGGNLTSPVISGDRLVVALKDTHSVVALDTETGEQVWQYMTGGRIDSPPALYNGMAIFGSHDGYVYCLRLSDGQLVWRFRAAASDMRTFAFGQIESVWPVIGSVLVHKKRVYCTAGRSSYIDGGITLFVLDPKSGAEIARNQFYSRDMETGKQPDHLLEDVELPGALPDILTVEAGSIFLRDNKLDADGKEDVGNYQPHLYSSAGLIDDMWWHRTYWIWGERAFGRAAGWAIAGKYRPSGRIFALDGPLVYGYDFKEGHGENDKGSHTLFCADKKVEKVDKQLKNNNDAVVKYMTPDKVITNWSQDINLCARAMVKAADTLFIAGPKATEEIYFDDKSASASLAAFDVKTGMSLSRIKIGAQPVFDGMAAANGRLYLSDINGNITCFSGE